MKNKICLLLSLLCFVMLMACSPADLFSSEPDMSKDPITQKWSVISFSVNGETTVLADEPEASAITASKQPKFSTSDGVNCWFEVNGNGRNGTIEKDGDEYKITFTDTDSVLRGTIDEENHLTLEIVGKTSVMVFEAVEE